MDWASASEIAGAVAGGHNALAITEAALARIAKRDPALNAFTAVVEARARDKAKAIDAARADGRPVGPLAGVPFAVKNLYDVKGLPTLAGSKINRSHPPAARDATLIERLEAAGAVLVAAIPTIRCARTARRNRPRQRSAAAPRVCGSRWPAAISRKACSPRRAKRSRAWPTPSTFGARSRFRKPNGRARRPMSSPRLKAR